MRTRKKKEIVLIMKTLNSRYQFINVSYFAMMAAMLAFASNYLLDLGYTNSQIGIILALYSIVSLFLQPVCASFSDNHPDIPLQRFIQALLAFIMVGSLIMFVSGKIWGRNLLLSVMTVLIFACMMSGSPLINTLAFIYEKYNIRINYGMARGLGSATYAVISMVLGYVVDALGAGILPITYILFAALSCFAVQTYRLKLSNKRKRQEEQFEKEEKNSNISFFQFLTKYKMLTIVLTGYMLVYTTHAIINNFYIQVIQNVGGTSSNMGIAVFIAALVELPAMFGFEKLIKRFRIETLMKVSLVMYALKHIVTFFATNVWGIYIASFLQIGAYAVFTPASVYFVNQIVSKTDVLMGQTVNMMFITMAGVLGSLLGGILMDVFSVHIVLGIGIVLTLAGTLLCFAGMARRKEEQPLVLNEEL